MSSSPGTPGATYRVEFRNTRTGDWIVGTASKDTALGWCEGWYSLATARAIVKRAKNRAARSLIHTEYRIVEEIRRVVE